MASCLRGGYEMRLAAAKVLGRSESTGCMRGGRAEAQLRLLTMITTSAQREVGANCGRSQANAAVLERSPSSLNQDLVPASSLCRMD